MRVRLWRLDGPLLAELTRVAVAGAEPAEVMPPLPADAAADVPEPPGWTPRREAAFGAFHRAQSMGPAAPQATFAIIVTDGADDTDGVAGAACGVADRVGRQATDPTPAGEPADADVPPPVDAAEPGERVVGAARLAPVAGEPGTVEAGLWIARPYRGRGVGRQVLRELRATARSRGARCLLARTDVANGPARRLLTEEYGATAPEPGSDAVTVRIGLNPVSGLLLGRPMMPGPMPSFDPERAPEVPGPLFVDWLAEVVAADGVDPQAATLSTVDADGFPDARVLALRDVDPEGGCWVFASDGDSTKGRQLSACPAGALTLYWPSHGRQIRVRGSVGTRGRELAADDFRSRSRASRVSGLVGRQSRPLGSLAEYDAAVAAAERRLAAEPDAVPPGHTVYALYAREVEFWQGATDRRHVRLRYLRSAPGRWVRELRWP